MKEENLPKYWYMASPFPVHFVHISRTFRIGIPF